MPERNLSELDPEWMMENFKVNALGPAFIVKHFGPGMIN